MIPVEFFWLALIVMFGLIGTARGLARELGVSTVVMLSLFTLWEGWIWLFSRFSNTPSGATVAGTVETAYFGVTTVLVAIISYEGYSLSFPVTGGGGVFKPFFGFLGGLLNGYLVVGTVWNAIANANYFAPGLSVLGCCLTKLHNEIVSFLPLSLMHHTSPFVFLVPGIILLLLIVLK